ncbi:MAG: hypothetical protein WAV05_01615 [Anaerolineales bacterium]
MMAILDKWDFKLTVDEVLQAQGADPGMIRLRRPSLIENTEKAIMIGTPLLHPQVQYEKYQVKGFVHQRLELFSNNSTNGKAYLSGPLIAQHLARSQEVIVIVCTIGSEIDAVVSSMFRVEPVIALALDGFGSAAVEKLSLMVCNYFEARTEENTLKTTMPLNPGMIGWPIETGQPQIFELVDGEEINVSLTDSCMMIPTKSLSMVLGMGKDVSEIGSSCDYCNLNGVCRYQDHYAK